MPKKIIKFVGNKRKTGYIPGYAFYVRNASDMENWKQIFTQVIYEAQNKQSFKKSVEEEDQYYLYKQTCNQNDDVQMEELQSIMDDYEYEVSEDQKKKEKEDDFNRLLQLMDYEQDLQSDEDDF